MQIYGGFASGTHCGKPALMPVTITSASEYDAILLLLNEFELQGWYNVQIYITPVNDEAYYADDRWKGKK